MPGPQVQALPPPSVLSQRQALVPPSAPWSHRVPAATAEQSTPCCGGEQINPHELTPEQTAVALPPAQQGSAKSHDTLPGPQGAPFVGSVVGHGGDGKPP